MRRKPGTLLPLETAILTAASQLRADGVRSFHGYELARHLADVSDRKLLTGYGTLYRALARLETMGLLESRWEDPQIAAAENRPGRRLYTLTAVGAAAVPASVTRSRAIPTARKRRTQRRVAPA